MTIFMKSQSPVFLGKISKILQSVLRRNVHPVFFSVNKQTDLNVFIVGFVNYSTAVYIRQFTDGPQNVVAKQKCTV